MSDKANETFTEEELVGRPKKKSPPILLSLEKEKIFQGILSERKNVPVSMQKEWRQALIENVPLDSLLLPGLTVRQVREIRLGLKAGIDVSIYAKKKIPDAQMREIREMLEEKQKSEATPIEELVPGELEKKEESQDTEDIAAVSDETIAEDTLIETLTSSEEDDSFEYVEDTTYYEGFEVPQKGKDIVIPNEVERVEVKIPLDRIQMHQIVLAERQHLPISLLCNPDLAPDQQHEIRIGLKAFPESVVQVYANHKLPSEIMREIRIALADGFQPLAPDYRDVDTLLTSYKQFYMRKPLQQNSSFPYTTAFGQRLYKKAEVAFIEKVCDLGLLTRFRPYLEEQWYTVGHWEQLLDGVRVGIDVSHYAYPGYTPEQMADIKDELIKASGIRRILMHKISVRKERKKIEKARKRFMKRKEVSNED